MSFQPVVPLSGNAGWAFLERTRESQQQAFSQSPRIGRETDAFEARIGQITSAEQLVADYELLTVALGAFGLSEDIGSRFFIRQVLEDGTGSDDALANRLTDKRYYDLAEAFAFDLTPPNTQLSDFGARIAEAYRERQFEEAVGETDEAMRLALSLEREIGNLAERDLSEDGLWFTIMATPPLRQVFEGALGLPKAIGSLDIDRQLTIFQDRALSFFGDSGVRQFAEPGKQDELIRRFLVVDSLNSAPPQTVRGSVALAILQASAQSPAIGL